MKALLIIGNDKDTITVAAKAIIDVLKHSNDVSSVAALNALAELARAPQHTQISNCVFESNARKRRQK